MSKGRLPAKTVSFVSQKGGVGKSALARLFAVGAAHRGHRALLADFDLDQLTCVEWNAARLQAAIEPEIDARAFKSLTNTLDRRRRFCKTPTISGRPTPRSWRWPSAAGCWGPTRPPITGPGDLGLRVRGFIRDYLSGRPSPNANSFSATSRPNWPATRRPWPACWPT